jgi:hypothetical protein
LKQAKEMATKAKRKITEFQVASTGAKEEVVKMRKIQDANKK